MKRFFLLMSFFLAAIAVRGDILYWMIDEKSAAQQPDFTYAMLYMESGSEKIKLAEIEGDISEIASFQEGGLYAYSAVLTRDPQKFSFFVELCGEEGLVATSAAMTYSDLASSIYAGSIALPTAMANPALFTAFAIPEPTSGLLLAFGGLLLALRRRRQV